jgi:hypothetical protein
MNFKQSHYKKKVEVHKQINGKEKHCVKFAAPMALTLKITGSELFRSSRAQLSVLLPYF